MGTCGTARAAWYAWATRRLAQHAWDAGCKASIGSSIVGINAESTTSRWNAWHARHGQVTEESACRPRPSILGGELRASVVAWICHGLWRISAFTLFRWLAFER